MLKQVTIECNGCGDTYEYRVRTLERAEELFAKEENGRKTQETPEAFGFEHLCEDCAWKTDHNYFLLRIELKAGDPEALAIVYDPGGLNDVVFISTLNEPPTAERIKKEYFESLKALGVPHLEIKEIHMNTRETSRGVRNREFETPTAILVTRYLATERVLDIRQVIEDLHNGKLPQPPSKPPPF